MRMTVRLLKIFLKIPNIDILLTFSQFSRKKCDKTHISGGWRPTWWLSIRFKRNTERAQNFTNYFWEPLTWPGDAEVACIYDVHKCSRASFSREHQTGILFFELIFSKQKLFRKFNFICLNFKGFSFYFNFGHEVCPKLPEGCNGKGQFRPQFTRTKWLTFQSKWPKMQLTRVCALNVILPPLRGGGSREAEGWPCDRKRISCPFATPTGAELRLKKKKKKLVV